MTPSTPGTPGSTPGSSLVPKYTPRRETSSSIPRPSSIPGPSRPFSPSPPRENRHTASRPPSLLLGQTLVGTVAPSKDLDISGLPKTPERIPARLDDKRTSGRRPRESDVDSQRSSSSRRIERQKGDGFAEGEFVKSPSGTFSFTPKPRSDSHSTTSSSSPPLGAASLLATLNVPPSPKPGQSPIRPLPQNYSSLGPELFPRIPKSPVTPTAQATPGHFGWSPSSPSSSTLPSSRSYPRLHQPTVVRSPSGRGIAFLPPPAQMSPTGIVHPSGYRESASYTRSASSASISTFGGHQSEESSAPPREDRDEELSRGSSDRGNVSRREPIVVGADAPEGEVAPPGSPENRQSDDRARHDEIEFNDGLLADNLGTEQASYGDDLDERASKAGVYTDQIADEGDSDEGDSDEREIHGETVVLDQHHSPAVSIISDPSGSSIYSHELGDGGHTPAVVDEQDLEDDKEGKESNEAVLNKANSEFAAPPPEVNSTEHANTDASVAAESPYDAASALKAVEETGQTQSRVIPTTTDNDIARPNSDRLEDTSEAKTAHAPEKSQDIETTQHMQSLIEEVHTADTQAAKEYSDTHVSRSPEPKTPLASPDKTTESESIRSVNALPLLEDDNESSTAGDSYKRSTPDSSDLAVSANNIGPVGTPVVRDLKTERASSPDDKLPLSQIEKSEDSDEEDDFESVQLNEVLLSRQSSSPTSPARRTRQDDLLDVQKESHEVMPFNSADQPSLIMKSDYSPPYKPRANAKTFLLEDSAAQPQDHLSLTLQAALTGQPTPFAPARRVELHVAWVEPSNWTWVPGRRYIPSWDLQLVNPSSTAVILAEKKEGREREQQRGMIRSVVGSLPIVGRVANWIL